MDVLDAETAIEEEETTTNPSVPKAKSTPHPTQKQQHSKSPPQKAKEGTATALLTCGTDSASCTKINGPGRDFPTDIGVCGFMPRKETIYLPTKRLYTCLQQRRRARKAALVKEHEALFARINGVQNPADCTKPSKAWHLMKLPRSLHLALELACNAALVRECLTRSKA